MMFRIGCMVPHCRCTTKSFDLDANWPDDGWICAKHWKGVPPRMRAVKRRVRRALQRAGGIGNDAMLARFARVSMRCTRAALDAAALGG